ncbi:MAG: DUF2231 domain-containing protein, partial [Deltaproteobacteria bacterium]|nr:DUF2231 domain-containing protein [Deltaproteobacteria bacterium]
VSAGLWAASTVPHSDEVHAIMMRHRNFGITVLASGVVLSIWRFISHSRFSRNGQVLHLIMAFITMIVMALGADLGGLMVYRYGVAVKAVPQPKGHIHGGKAHEAGEDQIEEDHHNSTAHSHEMNRGN